MLSLVIPAWSGTPELEQMLLKLCQQVREMCDELIVCEDGDYNQDIKQIADIYIKSHRRLGHAKNTAQGVAVASGDFIGIIDSDVVITRGTLRDLCIPGRAVSGAWQEFPEIHEVLGWCFVVDRALLENRKIGNPEWEGLGDWMKELLPYCIWTDIIEYSHIQKRSYSEKDRLGGMTTGDHQGRQTLWDRHRARMDEDPIYKEKWQDES